MVLVAPFNRVIASLPPKVHRMLRLLVIRIAIMHEAAGGHDSEEFLLLPIKVQIASVSKRSNTKYINENSKWDRRKQ